jgi:hypothetical protein
MVDGPPLPELIQPNQFSIVATSESAAPRASDNEFDVDPWH